MADTRGAFASLRVTNLLASEAPTNFWSSEILEILTKDSYMATMTLPETEAKETKNPTSRPARSMSTPSAAARPMATAR